MKRQVKLSHNSVDTNDDQYFQALLDLGVGRQEALFMLSIRNENATGDVLLPAENGKSGNILPSVMKTTRTTTNPKSGTQNERIVEINADTSPSPAEQSAAVPLKRKLAASNRKA